MTRRVIRRWWPNVPISAYEGRDLCYAGIGDSGYKEPSGYPNPFYGWRPKRRRDHLLDLRFQAGLFRFEERGVPGDGITRR